MKRHRPRPKRRRFDPGARTTGDRSGIVGTTAHGLRIAARAAGAGAVIAYPTEAVYGLGCDPCNATVVRRILAIKGRDESKGLILIAADFSALEPFVEPLAADAMAAIQRTWPGPNTWLLPARAETPSWLTGVHDTLAVRVTAHPVAAALCRAWGRSGGSGALVSTSANRSARPPVRSALCVRLQLGDAPDLLVSGPCGGADRPSVIRDGRSGRVLRG
ncbi:MAG: Sua5/YciO/YrdC/YwlC family protein [Thiohalocapsa sp.]